MSEKKITIRLETKDDYRAVENLTCESFWNVYRPGCMCGRKSSVTTGEPYRS